MKKALFFIIAIALCMSIFSGCGQAEIQEEFCRVMCLQEDGMILWIEQLNYVYVKHVDTNMEIDPLDTVVMEFSRDDLQSADEPFIDCWGNQEHYSYILEKPKSIRLTEAGEPTFA